MTTHLLKQEERYDERYEQNILEHPHIENARQVLIRSCGASCKYLTPGNKLRNFNKDDTCGAHHCLEQKIESLVRRLLVPTSHWTDVAAERDNRIAVGNDHDNRDNCLCRVDGVNIAITEQRSFDHASGFDPSY